MHSKTSVFDDRLARVGSANLNNRSGGFDTECELVVEGDDAETRQAIAASLSKEERIEILRGMLLTRATDNRLKAFFLGNEIRWNGVPFQGKGFRSLGQEAIYAAPLRLRRGPAWRG